MQQQQQQQQQQQHLSVWPKAFRHFTSFCHFEFVCRGKRHFFILIVFFCVLHFFANVINAFVWFGKILSPLCYGLFIVLPLFLCLTFFREISGLCDVKGKSICERRSNKYYGIVHKWRNDELWNFDSPPTEKNYLTVVFDFIDVIDGRPHTVYFHSCKPVVPKYKKQKKENSRTPSELCEGSFGHFYW